MDEEEQLKMALEQSKQEAHAIREQAEKGDKLLAMMKKLDEDKPDNWGLKKADPSKGGDEYS